MAEQMSVDPQDPYAFDYFLGRDLGAIKGNHTLHRPESQVRQFQYNDYSHVFAYNAQDLLDPSSRLSQRYPQVYGFIGAGTYGATFIARERGAAGASLEDLEQYAIKSQVHTTQWMDSVSGVHSQMVPFCETSGETRYMPEEALLLIYLDDSKRFPRLNSVYTHADMSVCHADMSVTNYLMDQNLNVQLIDLGMIHFSLHKSGFMSEIDHFIPYHEYQMMPERAIELEKYDTWRDPCHDDVTLEEIYLPIDQRDICLWKYSTIVYGFLHGFWSWDEPEPVPKSLNWHDQPGDSEYERLPPQEASP
ncbi:hypothetical protein E8E15_007988 [Penicillium rubens]|nr:hypothetical protein E8E15_007988 [Penicillium rubens]